jgi:hypothetical protein
VSPLAGFRERVATALLSTDKESLLHQINEAARPAGRSNQPATNLGTQLQTKDITMRQATVAVMVVAVVVVVVAVAAAAVAMVAAAAMVVGGHARLLSLSLQVLPTAGTGRYTGGIDDSDDACRHGIWRTHAYAPQTRTHACVAATMSYSTFVHKLPV